MQTTSILTSIDTQAGAAKANKQVAPPQSENSFNHYLNKEISAQKNADANKDAAAPFQTSPQSTPVPANSGKSKNTDEASSDEDRGQANSPAATEVPQDQSIGAQIIALVGNLAQFPRELEDTINAPTPTANTIKIEGESPIKSLDNLAGVNCATPTPQNGSLQPSESDAALPDKLPLNIATNGTVAAIATLAITEQVPPAPENFGELLAAQTSGSANQAAGKELKTLPPKEDEVRPNQEIASISDKLIPTALHKSRPEAGAENSAPVSNLVLKKDITETVSSVKTTAAPQVLQETGNAAHVQTANQAANVTDKIADQFADTKSAEAGKDSIATPAPLPSVALQANAVGTPMHNAVTTEHISPRVGTNGWDRAVAQKIVWMVGGSMQSAELTLNPPDLGPLQVVLSVNNDQANATFTAAQPEVREALESALPRLRQMLSDAGVQLTGFSVNAQTAGQGQAFSGHPTHPSPRPLPGATLADVNVQPVAPQAVRASAQTGLVDTFV